MSRRLNQHSNGGRRIHQQMKVQPMGQGGHRKTVIGISCGLILAVAMPTLATSGNVTYQPVNDTTGNTPLSDSNNAANSSGSLTALNDQSNRNTLAANSAEESKSVNEMSTDCAKNGLGKVAAESIKARSVLYGTPTNLDELFTVAKGSGCFSALADLPDLSISIPSFTGIMSAVTSTMMKYAQRKVCNVVNDATKKVFAPINDTMKKIEKYTTFDGAELLNQEMSEQLYNFDPEAMSLMVPIPNQTTYDLDSIKDATGYNSGAANSVNNLSYDSGTSNTTAARTTSTGSSAVDNAVSNLKNLFGNHD